MFVIWTFWLTVRLPVQNAARAEIGDAAVGDQVLAVTGWSKNTNPSPIVHMTPSVTVGPAVVPGLRWVRERAADLDVGEVGAGMDRDLDD